MKNEERPGAAALRARFQSLEAEFVRELRARGFTPEDVERAALPGPLAQLYAELEEVRADLEDAHAGGVGNLSEMKCVPCHGGVPRLRGEELRPYAEQVPRWQVADEHHLRREYK